MTDTLEKIIDELCSDKNITQEVAQRLDEGAEYVVKTILAFGVDPAFTLRKLLLTAAGLAGHACHDAVKKINPGLFIVVETKNGAKYYFGDALNKFFFVNKYSVFNIIGSHYTYLTKKQKNYTEDVEPIIKKVTANIGNDEYKICGLYEPEPEYRFIKRIFDLVEKLFIDKYCNDVIERADLYAFVLGKIMMYVIGQNLDPDEVFSIAVESANCMAKYDDDSFK